MPEFTDFGTLPAAHGSQNPFGRDGMGQIVFDGPATDLGAVELEGVKPQGFRGGKTIRAWRNALQPFFEETDD